MLSLQDVLALPDTPDPEHYRRLGLLPPVPQVATPSVIPPVGASSGVTVSKLSSVTPKPEPAAPAPVAAPDLGPVKIGDDTMQVKPMQPPSNLSFHERQALPTTSPGVIPGTSQFYENKLERTEDQKANPWGTPENHPGLLGKIGHVAAKIGNVAGDIVAPGTMANIPGTELNKQVEEGSTERKLEGAKKEEAAESETKAREASEEPLRAAQTEHEKAETDALRNKPDAQQKIAFHYTDKDGVERAVYEDGTEKKLSEVQQKDNPEKYPGLTADELAMFPPPQRQQFKTDEEFAAARGDWGKKLSKYKEDQKIREAVASRAPLQREYSVLDSKNGNAPAYVTPEMLSAEPGRYLPAGPAATALNKTGLIEDIRGTLGKMREAAERMGTEGFDKKQRAWLAAGLAAPVGQSGQYVESLLREPLSDAQQDYIIALFQARENAMAMRSVLGAGQGSEDLRTAITQTLPGAGTPSKEFFNKQVKAIEGTLNRLERGVPNVPLRKEAATTETIAPPKAGDVVDGHKFKGGDPSKKDNWEKVAEKK